MNSLVHTREGVIATPSQQHVLTCRNDRSLEGVWKQSFDSRYNEVLISWKHGWMYCSMAYPTDLTNDQWTIIEPIVTYQSDEDRYKGGRPRTVDLRRIMDALLYQARSGCQWRLLPPAFPPSGTVRYYFDKWTWDGTWMQINTVLREQLRMAHGRAAEPSAGSLDSQTVKTTEAGGNGASMGEKKLTGRKRHLLVDTEGNLITVVVHRANLQDRDGAYFVLEDIDRIAPELEKIWIDGAYRGELIAYAHDV